MITVRHQTEMEIRVLQGVTIFCQKDRCQQPATRLFRKASGPIIAYCQSHAKGVAERIGVKLPLAD
jgi:hypothetical protein